MVTYILALISLEGAMLEEEPRVLQPWYTNDVAMVGPVEQIARLLCALMEKYHSMGTFWIRRRVGMCVGQGSRMRRRGWSFRTSALR